MYKRKRSHLRNNYLSAIKYNQEIVILVLLATTLFLGMALSSYHVNDRSWFFYSSNVEPIGNLCGAVGAHVAAFLFYLFGASSFIFVGILFFIMYLIAFKYAFAQEWDRLGAAGLFLVVSATLCAVHNIDFMGVSVPGGFIGANIYSGFHYLFDDVGSIIFVYTLLLICFIVLSRFSFIILVRYMGHGLSWMFGKRYVVVPVYRAAVWSVSMLATSVVAAAGFVKKLYHGHVVQDEEYATASFDYELFQDADGTNDIKSEDAFWQEFLTKDTNSLSVDNRYATKIEFSANKKREEIKHIAVASKIVANNSGEDAGAGSFEITESVESTESVKSNSGNGDNSDNEEQYHLPSLDIFIGVDDERDDTHLMQELQKQAKTLEEKLERFGVCGTIVSIKRGPVVTLFEYQPAIDTKISKIVALEDDLALALQALSIRIIAPIPGRSVVGFEVANKQRRDVLFSSIAQSQTFQKFPGSLPLVLGEDTIGANVVIDLAKMPHLLIAGSTGSGKSVALNAMLVSLLFRLSPDELKLILIDPKRLEFASYADIAHLLFPIVTNPKQAAPVLRWVVNQMEQRYEKMATCGARSIFDYNNFVTKSGEGETLPFIVVVIDELADLMMTAGKDVEDLIARITQMARAAGIHMIIATQRPSVDVITGLIKVNFPSRVSFRVTSKIDSRTILDCGGADKLLGRGDMLFLNSADSQLRRVHGAYVSDEEINSLVNHIRSERTVTYLDISQELMKNSSATLEEKDQLYHDVVEFLNKVEDVSISLLQRKFRMGYNRSARIIDMLESQGLIMPADGAKTRKVIR